MEPKLIKKAFERVKNTDEVYCHFSYKRPRGTKGTGYFSVAFYTEYDGKNLIAYRVEQLPLWIEDVSVSSIQAYWFALKIIHEFQNDMAANGIKQVYLVTDNSHLYKWILEPVSSPLLNFMYRAQKDFRIGSNSGIVKVSVGLCEPRKYEKSYKFCKPEYLYKRTEKPKRVEKTGKVYLSVHRTNTVTQLIERHEKDSKLKVLEPYVGGESREPEANLKQVEQSV